MKNPYHSQRPRPFSSRVQNSEAAPSLFRQSSAEPAIRDTTKAKGSATLHQTNINRTSTHLKIEDLSKIFNTALISSRSGQKRQFAAELSQLMESSSFKSILSAIRQLAQVRGIEERQAAEEIIQTFRKMDEIWGSYVFQEGLEKLRPPKRT